MDRTLLTKQENTLYKAERLHMLQYPGICQFFILACIGADAFTLFSVFDLLLTQQKGITMVITITVASAMNIAPMLLAACLRNDELSKRMKTVLCILLSSLFTILFAVTFTLRFTSQEQLYGSTSDLGITIQGESAQQNEVVEEESFKSTAAQNILAVILGLEPLATSICSFVLAYEASPKRKHRHLKDLHNIELEEAIDHYKIMIQELKADMEFELEDFDQNQYEEFVAILYQKGELAKKEAIRKLAEHDGTPEGVSYLMEGEYLEQNKSTKPVTSISTKTSDEKEFNKMKSIA